MANKVIKQQMAYVLGDLIMSAVAIFLYNIARYYIMEDIIRVQQEFAYLSRYLSDGMVMAGQLCFPFALIGIYWLSGYYNDVYRKSIVQEAVTTFMSTFVSSLLIYFVALINEPINDHFQSYEIFLVLWGILLACVYPVRLAITLSVKRRIAQSQIEFPALIIGCGEKAEKLAAELLELKSKLGYKVVGFVSDEQGGCREIFSLPVFDINDVEHICRCHKVSDLIVVPQEHQDVLQTLNRLFPLNIPIKVISNDTRLFLSRGHLSTIHGEPLIDISCSNMSECEINMKRTADIVFSLVALVLLLPFFAIIAVIIKCNGDGPVVFKQQRVGLHGRSFTIYKFRTMVTDAEKDGKPRLTTPDDSRILPFGYFMRKYHIDELLQFWNVLRGDMSIVGPRPERKYFIDKIMERAPYYTMLLRVRPGITSFGMVKYGYASSIDDMLERMKYDIIYIENMSLVTDLKIIAYTISTVVRGKGL